MARPTHHPWLVTVVILSEGYKLWSSYTPYIIAIVRHGWLYEGAVGAMWGKKLSSEGSDSDSKRCKRGYGVSLAEDEFGGGGGGGGF
jgi:hypothetical protein